MNSSFLMMFNLISLGCGIYCLYTYAKLRIAGRLFPNSLLVPSGRKPKDCLDAPTYIAYVQPRLLILGILVTAFGIVTTLDSFYQFFSLLLNELLTVAMLGVIVWYAVCSSKANKRYWPERH